MDLEYGELGRIADHPLELGHEFYTTDEYASRHPNAPASQLFLELVHLAGIHFGVGHVERLGGFGLIEAA